MMIHYSKIDPSGNITLIVDSFVPRSEQSRAASELMQRDKSVEQVGFLEKPDDCTCIARLQMMGGEFCGNASLSAAAVMLGKASAPAGSEYTLRLEVSGAPEPVTIVCSLGEGGDFSGSVSMPLPESLSEYCFFDGFECYELPLVRFPGICHAIVRPGVLSEADAETLIGKWCSQLGSDALGLMFFDETESTLRPLVYVASTDSAVWEGSCASGTSAVAAHLAEIDGEHARVTLRQPRGTLSAQAEYGAGSISSLTLHGGAALCGEYSVELP